MRPAAKGELRQLADQPEFLTTEETISGPSLCVEIPVRKEPPITLEPEPFVHRRIDINIVYLTKLLPIYAGGCDSRHVVQPRQALSEVTVTATIGLQTEPSSDKSSSSFTCS